MKQMRTRYMQLGRTEIRAPLPERYNENKFACRTRARRSPAPLNRLFVDIEIRK